MTHSYDLNDLTFLNDAFRADPHSLLDRLRSATPRLAGDQFLFFTASCDASAVLSNASLSRDPTKMPEGSLSRKLASPAVAAGRRPASILMMDDPEHSAIRGLIQPAFFKRCAGMRARVESIVGELIDTVASEPVFDAVESVAVPLPIFVISDVLGLPRSDMTDLRRMSAAVAVLNVTPFSSPEMTVLREENAAEMDAYFTAAIAERRRGLRNDLISDLIAAEAEDGRRLSDSEILAACLLLLVAGNLTTTDLIANGILLLLTHRDELAKLRADPKLISTAIEEVLRFEPPVTMTNRSVVRDHTVAGCPVARGTTVFASLLAANRDPAVFDDPHVFRIDRTPNPHMSFGGGAHVCLGAPLARLEAQVAITRIFDRFPRLSLAEAEDPRPQAAFAFNGLKRLLVRTA